MITAVIPVHNRREITLRCLRQLAVQDDPRLTVVVVDDGSTDGTSEAIRRDHPDVKVVTGGGDLWWAGATNAGIRRALSESPAPGRILLLNDDIEISPDFVSTLRQCAEANPGAVIACLAVYARDPGRVYWCGDAASRRDCVYGYVRRDRLEGCVPASSLPGRAVLYPTQVLDDIGLVDDTNFPQYWADLDLSWRARDAGYPLLCCCDVAVAAHAGKTGPGSLHRRNSLRTFVGSFVDRRSPNDLLPMWRFFRKHYGNTGPARFAVQLAKVVGGEVLRRLHVRRVPHLRQPD